MIKELPMIGKPAQPEKQTTGNRNLDQMRKDQTMKKQNQYKGKYVVVVNPGLDDEEEIGQFDNGHDAIIFIRLKINRGAHLDIMKRMANGTLTSDF